MHPGYNVFRVVVDLNSTEKWSFANFKILVLPWLLEEAGGEMINHLIKL